MIESCKHTVRKISMPYTHYLPLLLLSHHWLLCMQKRTPDLRTPTTLSVQYKVAAVHLCIDCCKNVRQRIEAVLLKATYSESVEGGRNELQQTTYTSARVSVETATSNVSCTIQFLRLPHPIISFLSDFKLTCRVVIIHITNVSLQNIRAIC